MDLKKSYTRLVGVRPGRVSYVRTFYRKTLFREA